jgi:uncharacterized protein (DUF169 family)
MQVLRIDKYNEKQTRKWEQRYSEVMQKVRAGEKHFHELPQLAFYVFNKTYGFVAFDESKNKSLWAKTKKGVIEWWEDEERKRKIRGW